MKNYVGYTDEQLALLYVEGDNEAFDELLSRNQKAIYTYILFLSTIQKLQMTYFRRPLSRLSPNFRRAVTRILENFRFGLSALHTTSSSTPTVTRSRPTSSNPLRTTT